MNAPSVTYDTHAHQLVGQGDWDLAHLTQINESFSALSLPNRGDITFDGKAIQKMDSAGAWLINQWQQNLKAKGLTLKLVAFSKQYETLLNLIQKEINRSNQEKEPSLEPPLSRLATLGKTAVYQFEHFCLYLTFIGKLSYETLRLGFNPSHWRLNALAAVIYRNGFLALPIIALLSFMIGVVLTYQMGLQLRNYGANIFIVDLLGLAVLREFGPLLTAIMVAGRTGSSYTAELGIMKINQEIDALNTMGITPAELLLLPRIFGLIITLPLLTIWSDAFGVFGGMVMSNAMLNISWYDFIQRFPHVIPLKTLLIGLVKTPVFAFIISTVGCFQGMQVTGSADSVGRNTTKSVVLAIFFIIVADALFSILFSKLKL